MEELSEMKKKLQKETLLRKAAEEEVNKLKSQLAELKKSEVCLTDSTSVLLAFLLSVSFAQVGFTNNYTFDVQGISKI